MVNFVADTYRIYRVMRPENFVLDNSIMITIELDNSPTNANVVDEFLNQYNEEMVRLYRTQNFRRVILVEDGSTLLSEFYLRFCVVLDKVHDYKVFRVN